MTVKPQQQPLCDVSARPRLLDLFCGAGGAAVGYHRAGFDIIGVDHRPQPRFPFTFIQADALETLKLIGDRFDAIHASPPCQRYSIAQHIHANGSDHPDLLQPTRDGLAASGRPWVIENVVGAPMGFSVVLCGLMFGLRVLRHRVFEASFPLFSPPHPKHPEHLRTGTPTAKKGGRGNGYSRGDQGLVCVAGHNFQLQAGSTAMRIDWMTRAELSQAIPPAYTQYIGNQLIDLTRPLCGRS